MSWLQSLDTDLFRFVNLKLSNPVLDAIMPQFAGNAWFIPAVILLAVWLVWKGGFLMGPNYFHFLEAVQREGTIRGAGTAVGQAPLSHGGWHAGGFARVGGARDRHD